MQLSLHGQPIKREVKNKETYIHNSAVICKKDNTVINKITFTLKNNYSIPGNVLQTGRDQCKL